MRAERDRLQKALVPTLLVLGGVTAACSSEPQVYDVLDTKCRFGETTTVEGTRVASLRTTLAKGGRISISMNGSVLESRGDGDFSTEVSKNGGGQNVVESTSEDGRIVIMARRGPIAGLDNNRKVAVVSEKSPDGKTTLTFSLTCEDQTKIPPRIRPGEGLSPSLTKPSPQAYKGFGPR